MDETNTWFEWIAEKAKYLFWCILGAGMGAFGAVFFNAVDVGGDGLRIYLTVLTAMVGGSIALATARGMDLIKDRRETRRRHFLLLALTTDLREELENLAVMVRRVLAVGGRTVNDTGTNLNPKEVGELLARAERVYRRAATMPDLKDAIESKEDADQMLRVRSAFLHCADNFKWDPLSDEAARRQKCSYWVRVHSPDKLAAQLTPIEKYLSARIGAGRQF